MLQTAALIYVGDYFLTGLQKVVFLVNELNNLGFLLKKISFLEDNEGIVSYELGISSKQFDIVILVSELKDNSIFKALANSTFQDIKPNLKYEGILKTIQEPHAQDKCELPEAAKLLIGEDLSHPVIYIQRIFLLKEKYVEASFNILKTHLKQYRLEPKYSKLVQLEVNGSAKELLEKIKSLKVKYHCKEEDKQLLMTLESSNFEKIVECETMLSQSFQNNFIGSLRKGGFIDSIYGSTEGYIKQAIESIEECLETYGPENVFVSFNGGKDCTVLLHLVHTVLSFKYPNYKGQIFCLYVKNEFAFPEQDKFISQCQVYFNLEVITVLKGIKEALDEVLLKRPNIRACFMGTRRTDPFSSDLKIFQMTDPNWPQIMRVSPLLDWHYSDIWDYLLYYKVPYCKLYDQGFTSLGNSLNTIRNPSLSYHDLYLGKDVYLPAYKMLNESKERSGRNNIRT